jgi:hypothetical protein
MPSDAEGRPMRDVCLAAICALAVTFPAFAQAPQAAPTPLPGSPAWTAAPPSAAAPQTIPSPAAAVATVVPSPTAPIPSIPDALTLPPPTVTYANPLFRAADTPARSLDHPNPEDLEMRTTLFVAVHLDETGKVTEAIPVEPPVAALGAAATAVAPRWRFTPAKKGGASVATWATYGIDLLVELEKGVFGSFTLTPVANDAPLPRLVPEAPGDGWITRYPKEPGPADGTVSIEDVDVLPSPEKTPWSFDSVRARSRVRALVEVGPNGVVTRIAPIGETVEPLLVAWLRRSAGRWHVTPAVAGGKPVSSWMALDASLEYTVSSAKEKGKRSVKKNLRGTPTD